MGLGGHNQFNFKCVDLKQTTMMTAIGAAAGGLAAVSIGGPALLGAAIDFTGGVGLLGGLCVGSVVNCNPRPCLSKHQRDMPPNTT
jgi:hypothetical protein